MRAARCPRAHGAQRVLCPRRTRRPGQAGPHLVKDAAQRPDVCGRGGWVGGWGQAGQVVGEEARRTRRLCSLRGLHGASSRPAGGHQRRRRRRAPARLPLPRPCPRPTCRVRVGLAVPHLGGHVVRRADLRCGNEPPQDAARGGHEAARRRRRHAARAAAGPTDRRRPAGCGRPPNQSKPGAQSNRLHLHVGEHAGQLGRHAQVHDLEQPPAAALRQHDVLGLEVAARGGSRRWRGGGPLTRRRARIRAPPAWCSGAWGRRKREKMVQGRGAGVLD